MKRWAFFVFSILLLQACTNNNAPDVSGINTSTTVRRFDQDFFALDSNRLEAGLNSLNQKYPDFLPDYLVKVLGVNPADPNATPAIRAFLHSYQPVYEQASKMADQNLPEVQKQIAESLKYLAYYVPGYKPDSPFVITAFVGPMDAFEPFPLGDYGDVRTMNGAGIALQLHLGKNADIYENGKQAGIFYDYQTRRFTPETMGVNTMKNLVVDAFPYSAAGGTLIDEMIEKGKRLYLLQKIMPQTPDSLLLGYTSEQLEGCYENEALIWNFFVKNDLLYSKEGSINQNYIKDGPKTEELGEGSPGYIGLFVGQQLVKSYMKVHEKVTIPELMKTPAKQILDEANYKP